MATAPPKELFVSYGREPEVIQFVHRLKGDLENNGFSVWLDTQLAEHEQWPGVTQWPPFKQPSGGKQIAVGQ